MFVKKPTMRLLLVLYILLTSVVRCVTGTGKEHFMI